VGHPGQGLHRVGEQPEVARTDAFDRDGARDTEEEGLVGAVEGVQPLGTRCSRSPRRAARAPRPRPSPKGHPLLECPCRLPRLSHGPDCPQRCPHVWRNHRPGSWSGLLLGLVGHVDSISGLVQLEFGRRGHGEVPGRPGPFGPPGSGTLPPRTAECQHVRRACAGACAGTSRGDFRGHSLGRFRGWIAGGRPRTVDSAIHCARAQLDAARLPRGPTSARAFEEAMGETDISAEQPETEEETRFPPPHAQTAPAERSFGAGAARAATSCQPDLARS